MLGEAAKLREENLAFSNKVSTMRKISRLLEDQNEGLVSDLDRMVARDEIIKSLLDQGECKGALERNQE